jgi:hypothetical protein
MGKVALKRTFLVDHEGKLTHEVIRKLLMDCDENIAPPDVDAGIACIRA